LANSAHKRDVFFEIRILLDVLDVHPFHDCVKRPSSSLCRLRCFKIVYFTLHYITLHYILNLSPLATIDIIGHMPRPSDSQCAGSYRRSFETVTLSRMVAEILCIKHFAKHMPIENEFIPIFMCFRGKIGGYNILQLCAYSRSLGTSFELLTPTIGLPCYCSVRTFPLKTHYRGEIWGKVGEGVIGF